MRPPDVSSYVYLRTHVYSEASVTPGEKMSCKLRRKASGPFKVLRTHENTNVVVIEQYVLGERHSVHHMVPPGKNPTPLRSTKQMSNAKEDTPIGDGTLRAKRVPYSLDEFVIDRIVCHTLGDRSSRKYKIRWIGYGPDEDT